MLKVIMDNKAVVLTFAAALIVVCGVVASRLGSEFVPSLNEGDIAIRRSVFRHQPDAIHRNAKDDRKTLKKKFPGGASLCSFWYGGSCVRSDAA
jgi:cobalt-zinc-cadmium resistance protein CzcA